MTETTDIRPQTTDNILLASLLDSLVEPVLFADTEHIIRYMNKAAMEKYRKRGGTGLIGRSLFDCHNAKSRQVMIEVLAALHAGEEERLITDNAKHRVFMRAVRDAAGQVLGYYERYEPPAKQSLV